jgi:hypothetical protein
MKKIKNLYKFFFLLLIVVACDEDLRDLSFTDSIDPPTNVMATYDLTQDNTGTVTITPSADSAVSYEVIFGDNSESVTLLAGQNVDHVYAEGTYEVKIIASNVKGVEAEATQPLVISFNAPQNLVVGVENDSSVSKKVNITATAEFAAVFEFDSGETGVTQPVVTGNIGETISYQYANPGVYSVKVTAKGAAIATAEFTQEFEVVEILDPTNAAPSPPGRADSDVISLFSDVYTDVNVDTWNTSWSDSGFEDVMIGGNPTKKYTALGFNGIETTTNPIDASAMTHLHLDVWTPNATELKVKMVSFLGDGFGRGNGDSESEVTVTPTIGEWTSFDIELSDFTDAGITSLADLNQYIITAAPFKETILFVDNVYFYRPSSASTFNDGLLRNGDFENGSEFWLVGVDDSSAAPVVTDAGNTYYSVNVTNATPSQPFLVNTSQKVEIMDGSTYTLTFDAWSDRDRSIIAGIGLSGGTFANTNEAVSITSTRATYSVTLLADGFGATDARILFDLAAEVGLVNIDNVSMVLGNGNTIVNGDFENGSSPWIVGVDDSAPANVVTNNGNSYYSATVTNATPSQPFMVNVSQKLEIIDGNTYTLTFDAWSDGDRSIIAGIGLSGGSFANTNEAVNITNTRTTYSVTLLADGFGAADARVLFDLAAETGLVNIDNVTLSRN